jgi:hypothetical protein
MKKARTDFLFSTPSFLTGAATVFNLAGSSFLFAYSDSPEQADLSAMSSDWGMVANDINRSMEDFSSQEIHEEKL